MTDERKQVSWLGAKVKYLRANRKWSLSELGAIANLSKGYLSSIENGEVNVGIDTVNRLAKAFEMSPSVLLGGQDSELTADEQALIDAYRAGDKLGAITIVMAKGHEAG